MVLLVLTVVFLVLWLGSVFPYPNNLLSPAANFLAWITVALVVVRLYGTHLLG